MTDTLGDQLVVEQSGPIGEVLGAGSLSGPDKGTLRYAGFLMAFKMGISVGGAAAISGAWAGGFGLGSEELPVAGGAPVRTFP